MPQIIVDDRELALAEALERYPLEIKTTRLSCGDVVCGRVVIERKTREDFERSILDRRLFKQLDAMRLNYPARVVIVEGEVSAGIIRQEALLGAYAAVLADYQASLFFTKDLASTAELIAAIAKHEGKRHGPPSLVQKLPSWTPSEQLRAVVELFPLVGPKTAKALLKHFGTLAKLVKATPVELKQIEGIGKKRAEVLFRFFHREYKPEEDGWWKRHAED